MTTLKVRKIPFDFEDEVPFVWNPSNPEFSIMCNAVGILAIAFEKFVVINCKEARPLITDDAIAEENEAFMRQEGQHARMHRKHIAALVEQYPAVQQVLDEAVASFDALLETESLAFRLAYTADLEATFTPIFKLFLDHHRTLYEPGDDRVASLFVWHFVEEVEHRSSALEIYRHVVDDEFYRFRALPKIFRHVLRVFNGAVEGFAEVIPAQDQVINARVVAANQAWKREVGARLPIIGSRLRGDTPTALEDASSMELVRMAIGLVKSQVPGHDPTHQPLPDFALAWMDEYDEGRDVAHWYASDEDDAGAQDTADRTADLAEVG